MTLGPRLHVQMFQTNLGSYKQPQEMDTLAFHIKLIFIFESQTAVLIIIIKNAFPLATCVDTESNPKDDGR